MKQYINKKNLVIAAIGLAAGTGLGWIFFHGSPEAGATGAIETTGKNVQKGAGGEAGAGGATGDHAGHDHKTGEAEETTYTCSMHPQIRQDEPGQCPICAMDLVRVESLDEGEEEIPEGAIAMSESAMKLAGIQTTTVTPAVPEHTMQLLGRVTPDERRIAEITARYGGRIEELFVNFTGQQVERGERLATIYSPELVTAQQELLEAATMRENQPGYYEAAVNKLRLWDLSDRQIREIVENGEPDVYMDILAPINGTVTMRHVSPGDYVTEGESLMEVVDLNRLWVMFEAYESHLPWISEGDAVTFSMNALPGKQFQGKVSYIDPVIDPDTRVARLRVEVPNAPGNLKPGMFARGRLVSDGASGDEQLLIPKSAVLWTGKRSVVYVKVPDREAPAFNYREVVLGPQAGDEYVVSDGLSAGEEIATYGVFKIDAAAQLEGKPSMMNPGGGATSTGHDHGGHAMSSGSGTASASDDPHDHATETASVQQDHSDHAMSSGDGTASAQQDHSSHGISSGDGESSMAHEMFTVRGNCGMCKTRIEEAALSLPGVEEATWSSENEEIHVTYDDGKVSLEEIHRKIASVGHDTDLVTAPDSVYEALPGCCLYRD